MERSPSNNLVQSLKSLVEVLPRVKHLKTIIYIDTDGSEPPTEAQAKAAKAAGDALSLSSSTEEFPPASDRRRHTLSRLLQ